MKYQCPHCKQTFARRNALRNHIKIHSSDKIDRILENLKEEEV